MAIVSDATLTRSLSVPLTALRRRLARRAAGRGLHAAALAAAPDDPAVLTLLGLYLPAGDARPRDRTGRWAQAVAAVALGGSAAEKAGGDWPPRWRRRLAYAAAPTDPFRAAALLADDPIGRAAALIAAGECEDALASLTGAPDVPEASIIRAAIAIRDGDADGARDAIGRVFSAFDLAPPLSCGAGAFSLDSFAVAAPAVVDGPLVSVIVPLHDGAATIATALRSLLRQSWRQTEIIVCDDRSQDSGPAIVAAIAQAEPRVRLIRNREAAGASGARNSAIAAADGAFIAFLDADDWAHPARIARQMARLGGGAATVSRHFRIDEHGCPVAPRVVPMIRLCPISMVVRRAVLEQAGGFEASRAGADAELLGRIETLYGRAAVPRDPAPLTVARWRPNSISNDAERGLFDRERLAYRERWMRAHAALFAAGGLPRPVPAS